MAVRYVARFTTVVAVGWLVSCGASGSTARPELAPAQGESTEPLSAADIARGIIGGRTGALFELQAFRFHPSSANAIGELGNWAEAMERLGLDPLMDVSRVFVAAVHANDSTGIVIIEPEVDDRAIASALVRAGGRAGKDEVFPWAKIPIKGEEDHIAALVQPRMLVLVPARFANELGRLRAKAVLPRPSPVAAAQFFAFEPDACLGTNPVWPPTIVAAHAEITFTRNGGAVVRFFADSISAEQAELDAKALTQEAHRLLTVNLGLLEMHLLDPPVFEAVGERIFMQTGLLPTDVDWLLSFDGGFGL